MRIHGRCLGLVCKREIILKQRDMPPEGERGKCPICGGEVVWYRGVNEDTERGSVLLDAHTVINGDRQDVYGSPEDSFALIAKYWNVYLKSRPRDRALPSGYKDAPLEKADVAMMMVLFKIAREANQHKRDSVTDACGYFGIYADMQDGAE